MAPHSDVSVSLTRDDESGEGRKAMWGVGKMFEPNLKALLHVYITQDSFNSGRPVTCDNTLRETAEPSALTTISHDVSMASGLS